METLADGVGDATEVEDERTELCTVEDVEAEEERTEL